MDEADVFALNPTQLCASQNHHSWLLYALTASHMLHTTSAISLPSMQGMYSSQSTGMISCVHVLSQRTLG